MNDPSRPDPDTLLAAIKQAENAPRRGKLTILLGMCPGVGKTYAMLRAAQQRKAEGLDVAVGFVETHGRAATRRSSPTCRSFRANRWNTAASR